MEDQLGKTAMDYADESKDGDRIIKLLAKTEFERRVIRETGHHNSEECDDESKDQRKTIKRLDSGPEKRITRNCRPPLGKVCLRHNDRMYLASLSDNEYPFPCIVLQPGHNITTG